MKFKFEKFMKDIVEKEDSAKKELPEEKNVTPQRRFNKLYRERWQNRITYRRKNESN